MTTNANYLISDGYTQDGYVSEVDGLHGDVFFQFRPALHDEREAIIDRLRTPGRETSTAIMARVICDHVQQWDIPVNLEPGRVARLFPSLFDKLFSIVMGHRSSDPVPGDRSRQLPAQMTEVSDLKN